MNDTVRYTLLMIALRTTTLRGILAVIGTIIGAGIFGVPAMMDRVGIIGGSVIFWIIAALILATHLMFVEVIANVDGRRRLPGYVGSVLGESVGRFAVLANTLQLVGANIAYVVLGGVFLKTLADRSGIAIGLTAWQLIFWLVGAVTAYMALKVMARIEAALSWALVGVMLFLLAIAAPRADIARIGTFDLAEAHAPIGVFLFAMFGLTVIAEVFELTGRNVKETRRSVGTGTAVAAILTWLFGVFVTLALPSGASASPERISELFHPALWWVVPLFGFLAVITSFITSAFNLESIYRMDVGTSKIVGWGIATGVPLALLFFTNPDFFSIIETVGALFSATCGLLVVAAAHALYRKTKSRYPFWQKEFIPFAAIALFIAAILQRVFAFALY